MPDTPEPPDASVAKVRCTTCGKVVRLTQADVDLHTQAKTWPSCCDQVMSLSLTGEWRTVPD